MHCTKVSNQADLPPKKPCRDSPREQASATNVVKLQEEHDDSLKADATTSVGWRTEAESIDIGLHIVRVDADATHAIFEHCRVVKTLGTRQNLLSTHEEVVRVGQFLDHAMMLRSTESLSRNLWTGTYSITRVGHGVERSKLERELVDDVVVSVVFLLDEFPKGLFG